MTKSRISGEEIRDHYNLNRDGSVSLSDMFHLTLMNSLRLTDSEYDIFLEIVPEDDFLELFREGKILSFNDKRYIVNLINRCKLQTT